MDARTHVVEYSDHERTPLDFAHIHTACVVVRTMRIVRLVAVCVCVQFRDNWMCVCVFGCVSSRTCAIPYNIPSHPTRMKRIANRTRAVH